MICKYFGKRNSLNFGKRIIMFLMMGFVVTNLVACASKSNDSSETKNTSSKVRSSEKKTVKKRKETSSKVAESQSSQANSNVSESYGQSSQTSQESASTTATEQMDFSKIQQGDYGSLLGEWQEVATSVNRQDATGSHWGPANGDTLEVTKDKLVNGTLWVQGTNFSDGTTNHVLIFSQKDGYLVANIADQDSAINYAIYFYPKGVNMTDFGSDLPTSIDSSKNRIVIWSSSDSYIEVFQSSTN